MRKEKDSDRLIAAAGQYGKEKEYWLDKLSGELDTGFFPYDHTGVIDERRMETVSFDITGPFFSRLLKVAGNSDIRLHMILTAGVVALIARYTGSSDILVGAPIYKQEVEGEFTNTVLVLRNRLDEGMTFKELLIRFRQTLGEAVENANYPIETLLYHLNISPCEHKFPLFEVAVLLENIHDKKYLRHIHNTVTFCFKRTGECLEGNLEYNALVYDPPTIQRMITHVNHLLQEAIFNVDRELSVLEVLSEAEKKRLLKDFNDNRADFSRDRTIHQLISHHGQRSPDRAAVGFKGKNLGYGGLDRWANRLAAVLKKNGIQKDKTVGILMERSPLMVACILAVWKAGGAYIPLDPFYPAQRILGILDDSGTSVLLTEAEFLDGTVEASYKGQIVTDCRRIESNPDNGDSAVPVDMGSLAYVIYTSGSTGKPKGAMVEHIGMMNHIRAKTVDLQLTGDSIIAQNASHTFDISVWQFFAALTLGGKTVVYPDECVLEPGMFIEAVGNDRVTILEVVPSYLTVMLESEDLRADAFSALQYLLVTGEEVKPNLAKRWFEKFPRIKMVNAYGPTEASDDITHHIMDAAPDGERVPIGKPLQNLNIYIVDENMKLCPIGIKGEICVSGVGVGRGYLNDDQRSKQVFMEDPFHEEPGVRLYKTGDLGCWLPDGTIEFFGRKDYQVKIRGFRIEMGEIEGKLSGHPAVKEAVVTDWEDDGGGKYLCAYLVPVVKEGLNIQQIKDFLLQRLPDYMVPAHFVSMEAVPLTPNGKVDRKALPEPVPAGLSSHMTYISEEVMKAVALTLDKGEENVNIPDKKGGDDNTEEVEYILSAEEREKVVYTFNHTEKEFPEDVTIKEMFEARVEKVPGNTALVFGNNKLTYGELNLRANCVARVLRREGITAGAIVGIMVERSIEMMTGIFGILKAGAAFMPIDPEAPEDRQLFMLKDGSVNVLLTNRGMKIAGYPYQTIGLDNPRAYEFREDIANLPVFNRPTDISHILYTSGTTGIPKGVMLENRSVVNLMEAVADLVSFKESDNVASFTPITFDVFSAETLLPLTRGSKVVVASLEAIMGYKDTAALIEREQITICQSTPSVLQRFTADPESAGSLRGLKYLLTAGEALFDSLLEQVKLYTDAVIYNLYGPTETTIFSTAKDVSGKNTVSIGRPVDNTRVYILDKKENVVPIGVNGELCIGGVGVARGYMNRPELTEEKFIPNPFAAGDRFYKTGDLSQWLPNGDIEYIGRIDHQIKLGGIRIEPGEIESCLLMYPGVREAAVVIKESEDIGKFLYAFLVSEKKLEEAEIRAWISKKLPVYMIPGIFVQLEKMPMTHSRKINRRLLAALQVELAGDTNYNAPKTEIERKLVEIWSTVLGISTGTISIDTNFFELGGHSLKATILATKTHKELDVKLPMAEIFKTPTVRGLAQYIESAVEDKHTSVEKAEDREYYRLSSAQRRLYVLQQMEPESTAYNLPQAVMLKGKPDKERLESVFKQLLKRHESLRTSFEMIGEEPVQRIHPEVGFEINYYDLEVGDTGERRIVEGFVCKFDLSRAPLFRVILAKKEEEKHLLVVDMHHIISDGVSSGILVKDFMSLYAGKKLKPLPFRYRDFSEWQSREQVKKKLKAQETYWLKELKGELPRLILPFDFPRPEVQSFDGGTVSFAMDKEVARGLKTMAVEKEATLYMVLLAIYNILLAKLSSQEDIVAGTVIAAREHADLEQVIGMFVNTLVLRNMPRGEKSFDEFLEEVRERTLSAFDNQEYLFGDLVEQVEVDRDPGRNPLFDVMFSLENVERPEVEIPGMQLEPYPWETNISKFDLSLVGVEDEGRLILTFEYCIKLFKRETIRRFVTYFKHIAASVLKETGTGIADIDMMPEEERNHLLYDFNRTGVEYRSEALIHRLLEEQAGRTPDKIAVKEPGKNCALSYRDLNEKAGILAGILRKRGVAHESIVGFMAKRSIEAVIGMLGILKAGAAYLPIDPGYPQERINYILQDSNAKVVLSEMNEVSGSEGVASTSISTSTALAYVIYTSGSTGRPKGVMVPHRGVIRLVNGSNFIELSGSDRLLMTGAVVFDISTFEIWGALLNGASLYLAHDEETVDAERLENILARHKITVLHLVPQLLDQLAAQSLDIFAGLDYLLVGGDLVRPHHISRVRNRFKDLTILHMYGPTENTTFSTFQAVERGYETAVPIGRPLRNSTVYIMDRHLKPVPPGTAGELCVGGDGVARGYLNNPELTAEQFVVLAVNTRERGRRSDRIYRTGDLSRWLPDSTIEFLGRTDQQVKIRGIRIELGEIENKLLMHDEINEAVVVMREDEAGNQHLCAYIIADNPPDEFRLAEYLSGELPGYMIPAYFMPLENFPLTPGGKVDRKALPAPGAGSKQAYAAPEGPVEKALVQVWQEVLGAAEIGVHDNFFQVGGDSIKSIQIAARLQKYGFKLDIKTLLLHKTIKEIGKYIKRIDREIDQGVVTGEVRLTPVQRYFFEHHVAARHHFNQSVMLYRREGFDEDVVGDVLTKLAAHHDALRMVYKEENNRIRQVNRGLEGDLFYLEAVDLRDIQDEAEAEAGIERECNRLQASMDLQAGPLVKAGMFKTCRGDHLLITIHHLVMDAVSWQILLEDFATGYNRQLAGEDIRFPAKTDAFKYWAEKLNRYSQSKEILKELPYWQETEETVVNPLPVDFRVGEAEKKIENLENITLSFNKEKTGWLLKEANQAYNTEMNDLLLTALGMTVNQWAGIDRVAVNLEGHGRESIMEEIDINRTVGWFTSLYPVVLDMTGGPGQDPSYRIKSVKETLRRIPNKGVGYGILKYLTPEADKQGISFNLNPEISFNYLGQFGQEGGNRHTGGIEVSPLGVGDMLSPGTEQRYVIDINGMLLDEELRLVFSYNKYQLRRDRVEQLVESFRSNLEKILIHCIKKEEQELTPSDLDYSDLSIEKLEELENKIGEIDFD